MFLLYKKDYINIDFRDFLIKFENVGIPDEWFFVNILMKNNIKINNENIFMLIVQKTKHKL